MYLYRILSPEEIGQAPARAQGHELLPNGSFEDGEATHPSTWDLLGNPQYDPTGSESRTGQGAVRLARARAPTATVPVRSGRRISSPAPTTASTTWHRRVDRIERRAIAAGNDATGGKSDLSPRRYRAYTILATSPQQAATAVVSDLSHGRGPGHRSTICRSARSRPMIRIQTNLRDLIARAEMRAITACGTTMRLPPPRRRGARLLRRGGRRSACGRSSAKAAGPAAPRSGSARRRSLRRRGRQVFRLRRGWRRRGRDQRIDAARRLEV